MVAAKLQSVFSRKARLQYGSDSSSAHINMHTGCKNYRTNRPSIEIKDMSSWELLVHLDKAGWIHKKLCKRPKKSDRLLVEPIKKDEVGQGGQDNRIWWTRAGAASSHKYLLVLACIEKVFATVPISDIEHFQAASYYQALLDGKVPIKGGH
jgi:hypothetical protein